MVFKMRGFFSKRNVVLSLAILLLVVLVISSARGKYEFTWTKNVLTTALKPLRTSLTGIGEAISKTGRFAGSLLSVYEENDLLRKEVAALRKANIDAGEVWAENQRLHELLNYKQSQNSYILLPARVVGFNPGGLEGNIIIDKGQKDGVTRDMSVITADGLVGSISDVYKSSSRVQLILHPRSAIGGIVQRPGSRVVSIVSGNASTPFTPNFINLARDADVVNGDTILTSGFGGIYPKGILIGTVSGVVNAEGGLLKYAVITPTVDFSRLEEVMIITNVTNFAANSLPVAEKAGEKK